jgi:HNH endonuclease
MTIPPRRSTRLVFPPVNRCIYCNQVKSQLTDEHIIPFALGGVMELPKASCKDCAKITHAFEYTCMRQMFGRFRIRHNVKTRRKKDRPKKLAALIRTPDGNTKEVIVDASEYPTELFMYKFKTAGALLNLPQSENRLMEWDLVGISDRDELIAFGKKHGGQFMVRTKMVPFEFARMLAKISHSFAVSQLGLNGFQPLALDAILGRTENISYVVGGTDKFGPRIPDGGHLLELEYKVEPNIRRSVVIVHIRLFSILDTPNYHVVVGRIQDTHHVRTLFQQMQKAESVEVLLPGGKFGPR